MPNTLAHVGVQGLVTRFVFRDADPKWIYLGCILPDIPWMLQRAVVFAIPHIDTYTLRLYVDVQASLFGSLFLCAAVALFSRQFEKIFLLLGMNTLLHLVLDACETKWANGVHLFAPFSWELTNWGFFWPESLISYFLTGLGFAYILWHGRLGLRRGTDLKPPDGKRLAWGISLIAVYFTIPMLFTGGPEAADNHFLRTLNTSEDRAGRYVEFDRVRYVSTPEGGFLQCCTAEGIRVEGLDLHRSATISLRGTFTSEDAVRAIEGHVHLSWFRDGASYVGLVLIAFIWVVAWLNTHHPVLIETERVSVQ